TARQLAARAEPALIAAVGLDLDKRRQVEQVLAERLRAPDLPPIHQLGLIVAAATLGNLEAFDDLPIPNRLLPMGEIKVKEVDQDRVAQQLVKWAARLKPAEAGAVLTKALEKETEVQSRQTLAAGLVAVVERLEPREGSQVIAQALEKETDGNARKALVEGL